MNTTPIDHKIEFMAWLVNANPPIMVTQDEMSIIDFSSLGEALDYWVDGSYILQLTALRSINDDPIYNHMIVQNEYETYYEVDMFDYDKMYFLSGMALEIVGNRFQNPELLEMCK